MAQGCEGAAESLIRDLRSILLGGLSGAVSPSPPPVVVVVFIEEVEAAEEVAVAVAEYDGSEAMAAVATAADAPRA
jgi:hypothetical protein